MMPGPSAWPVQSSAASWFPAAELQATSVSPWVAGLAERRRRALGEVTAELDAHRRADESAVALRDYGPGCVCLGIAGPVDRALAERLQSLLGELRVRARRELVITLAGLGPWHRKLARVLAHARIQHLVDGARVDLHDLPEPLADALGHVVSTTYLVADTTPPAPLRRLRDRGPTITPSRGPGDERA